MDDTTSRDDETLRLRAREIEDLIRVNLPPVDHHDEIVEEVGARSIRIRFPFRPEFMGTEPWRDGSGEVFSGPMVMGFGDTAMYGCVLAVMGADVIPVMVTYNITFLRPARPSDVFADARVVRRGGRLHYLECWLHSEGRDEPFAHATSNYRVARR